MKYYYYYYYYYYYFFFYYYYYYNRHDFLVLYFCVVNFCEKNVCGNFYLREIISADRWKNRKNFVPHGIQQNDIFEGKKFAKNDVHTT